VTAGGSGRPQRGGSVNADEQSIRNLVAQWHRATAAGDVDTVLGLMSEDVVFLVAGKSPMKGRGNFEKGLRGLLKSHRLESSGDVREVRVSGDLAYCWTLLSVRMTPLSGGDASERSGSALSIFRKHANTWLLARDANLLPPP
jgi:uncharacterized protein (TIGR02246 family)